MRFSWFLALRYLKPKRTFLSIITVISVLGVMLGVGVLIVVIAVMSGFEKRIKDEWLKVEPPLFLHDDKRSYFAAEEEESRVVPEWRELLPKVKSFPAVQNASPFINVVALMQQAKPKRHDETEVQVGDLPPDAPPPELPAPAPEAGEPPAEETTPAGNPAPPPEAPNKPEAVPAKAGPKTKPAPATPAARAAREKLKTAKTGKTGSGAAPQETAEEPAAGQPAPVAEPAAPPDADVNVEALPGDAEPPDSPPAPGDGNPAEEDIPYDGGEEEVTGLDRTRPLTHVMLIGVDTDNVDDMEKYRRRFEELRSNKPRRAEGEFDLSESNVVLSELIVEKLFLKTQESVEPGLTYYNAFGPSFIYEGIDIVQEKSEARGDAGKQKEVDEKDRVYPLPAEFQLAGYFNDEKQQSGGMQAIGYISLKNAQTLAGSGGTVDGLAVELADPYEAPAVAEKLRESGLLPEGWRTETWIERHRQQFEAVANERSMMYIVLGFISVVAAFCIMNTMITMAVQKRREIGMMRALGAKTSHIIGLFMVKGFIVGLFGTGLGYGLGRLVLAFRNDLREWINDHFGHQIFDATIYGLSEIPADLRRVDELVICGLAFVLCTLAAVPPAWMVGRMAPARALRNDR